MKEKVGLKCDPCNIKRRYLHRNMCKYRSFYWSFYCKNSFLKRSTQTKSIQPKTIPEGIVTRIQTISLKRPPCLRKVPHLTMSSTIQFTPGMIRRRSWISLDCLLNQVIVFPPVKAKCLCGFATNTVYHIALLLVNAFIDGFTKKRVEICGLIKLVLSLLYKSAQVICAFFLCHAAF